MSGKPILGVRRTVAVDVPVERAFRVFTEEVGRWWPLDTHHTNPAGAVTAVIEPRVGGRWFERAEDGSETDWGRVLAWEPPDRLVLAWHLSPQWRFDPDPKRASEVEVRFVAEGPASTRVELEHRKFEVYGAEAETVRDVFEQPNAWTGVLDLYRQRIAG